MTVYNIGARQQSGAVTPYSGPDRYLSSGVDVGMKGRSGNGLSDYVRTTGNTKVHAGVSSMSRKKGGSPQ